jgi:aminoacrylate hydrolase
MPMPTITAPDGCRIAFDVTGDGDALLLIPGLGGAATFWEPVAPLLAKHNHVVTMDHRGAGRSDRPAASYSIEQIAADAVQVMDVLGIGCAHIVGHSTGGVIAQVLVLDHPDRVNRLVISGSWARFDARMALLFQARADVLERAGPEVYQRLTHALGFPAAWIEGHGAQLEDAVAAAGANLAPLEVALKRIRMLSRTDRSKDLARIAAPTMIIGAPDDPMVPFYQSEKLAATIPGARLERISGSHFFPRVKPDQFAAVVRDFLEGPDGPR